VKLKPTVTAKELAREKKRPDIVGEPILTSRVRQQYPTDFSACHVSGGVAVGGTGVGVAVGGGGGVAVGGGVGGGVAVSDGVGGGVGDGVSDGVAVGGGVGGGVAVSDGVGGGGGVGDGVGDGVAVGGDALTVTTPDMRTPPAAP